MLDGIEGEKALKTERRAGTKVRDKVHGRMAALGATAILDGWSVANQGRGVGHKGRVKAPEELGGQLPSTSSLFLAGCE